MADVKEVGESRSSTVQDSDGRQQYTVFLVRRERAGPDVKVDQCKQIWVQPSTSWEELCVEASVTLGMPVNRASSPDGVWYTCMDDIFPGDILCMEQAADLDDYTQAALVPDKSMLEDDSKTVNDDAGGIFALGSSAKGRCGTPNADVSCLIPYLIRGGLLGRALHVTQVSCGGSHTAVLLNSGRCFMFGSNHFGQLGIPLKEEKEEKRGIVRRATAVVSSTFGKLKSSALQLTDAIVAPSDDGNDAPEGQDMNKIVWGPRVVQFGGEDPTPEFSSVACGRNHTVLLTRESDPNVQPRLYATGSNRQGQLGYHMSGDEPAFRYEWGAVPVDSVTAPTELIEAAKQGIAKDTSLTLGDNVEVRMRPVSVKAGFEFNVVLCEVSVDEEQLEEQRVVGSVFWVWGANQLGQLGLGADRARSAVYTPEVLMLPSAESVRTDGYHSHRGLPTVTSYDCGGEHVGCTTQGGQVFTWGDNSYGQTGHFGRVVRVRDKIGRDGTSFASQLRQLPFVDALYKQARQRTKESNLELLKQQKAAHGKGGLKAWLRRKLRRGKKTEQPEQKEEVKEEEEEEEEKEEAQTEPEQKEKDGEEIEIEEAIRCEVCVLVPGKGDYYESGWQVEPAPVMVPTPQPLEWVCCENATSDVGDETRIFTYLVYLGAHHEITDEETVEEPAVVFCNVACGRQHTLLSGSCARPAGPPGVMWKGTGFVMSATGASEVLERKSDGLRVCPSPTVSQLFSCGGNSHGQLGLGHTKSCPAFTAVQGINSQLEAWHKTPEAVCSTALAEVDAVFCGFYNSFVALRHLSVDVPTCLLSCGRDGSGELGLGDTIGRRCFSSIRALQGQALATAGCAAGPSHTVVVRGPSLMSLEQRRQLILAKDEEIRKIWYEDKEIRSLLMRMGLLENHESEEGKSIDYTESPYIITMDDGIDVVMKMEKLVQVGLVPAALCQPYTHTAIDVGTHIFRTGAFGTGFTHHGVYIGHGKVVHFTGGTMSARLATIRVDSLHEFAKGHRVFKTVYVCDDVEDSDSEDEDDKNDDEKPKRSKRMCDKRSALILQRQGSDVRIEHVARKKPTKRKKSTLGKIKSIFTRKGGDKGGDKDGQQDDKEEEEAKKTNSSTTNSESKSTATASGNFVVYQPFTPEEVVHRALSRVGESGYQVFTNNCEHFSRWCVLGKNDSLQVKKAMSAAAKLVVPLAFGSVVSQLELVSAAGRMMGIGGSSNGRAVSTVVGTALRSQNQEMLAKGVDMVATGDNTVRALTVVGEAVMAHYLAADAAGGTSLVGSVKDALRKSKESKKANKESKTDKSNSDKTQVIKQRESSTGSSAQRAGMAGIGLAALPTVMRVLRNGPKSAILSAGVSKLSEMGGLLGSVSEAASSISAVSVVGELLSVDSFMTTEERSDRSVSIMAANTLSALTGLTGLGGFASTGVVLGAGVLTYFGIKKYRQVKGERKVREQETASLSEWIEDPIRNARMHRIPQFFGEKRHPDEQVQHLQGSATETTVSELEDVD